MYVYNSKYDIEHDKLEEKIYSLADELNLLPHEVERELEDLKWGHDDWDVDKLFEKIRSYYKGE